MLHFWLLLWYRSKALFVYTHAYETIVSLNHGCHSDQEEQLWVWQYEAEDGTHDMFMDIDEEVRFRVVEEVFVDTLPTNSKNLKWWRVVNG